MRISQTLEKPIKPESFPLIGAPRWHGSVSRKVNLRSVVVETPRYYSDQYNAPMKMPQFE